MPRRWWLQGSVVAGLEQAQLLACFGRVLLVLRDDFRAVFGVTSEDAVVAEHVKARGRDERAQSADEIQRLKQHGVRSVLPRALEPNADAPVVMLLEAVE